MLFEHYYVVIIGLYLEELVEHIAEGKTFGIIFKIIIMIAWKILLILLMKKRISLLLQMDLLLEMKNNNFSRRY